MVSPGPIPSAGGRAQIKSDESGAGPLEGRHRKLRLMNPGPPIPSMGGSKIKSDESGAAGPIFFAQNESDLT